MEIYVNIGNYYPTIQITSTKMSYLGLGRVQISCHIVLCSLCAGSTCTALWVLAAGKMYFDILVVFYQYMRKSLNCKAFIECHRKFVGHCQTYTIMETRVRRLSKRLKINRCPMKAHGTDSLAGWNWIWKQLLTQFSQGKRIWRSKPWNWTRFTHFRHDKNLLQPSPAFVSQWRSRVVLSRRTN